MSPQAAVKKTLVSNWFSPQLWDHVCWTELWHVQQTHWLLQQSACEWASEWGLYCVSALTLLHGTAGDHSVDWETTTSRCSCFMDVWGNESNVTGENTCSIITGFRHNSVFISDRPYCSMSTAGGGCFRYPVPTTHDASGKTGDSWSKKNKQTDGDYEDVFGCSPGFKIRYKLTSSSSSAL